MNKLMLIFCCTCLSITLINAEEDKLGYLENFHYDVIDHEASQEYIKAFKDIAISEMERLGIPASIKLGQGILESGWGKSTLATKANNHFGIKCGGSWNGKTYYIKDDDRDAQGNLIKSCFRSYNSAQESYIAHSEFLKRNQRYAKLFTYDKTDYKKWAHGLKQAGYATSPTYAQKLIKIIEDNQLYKYDKMAADKPNKGTATEAIQGIHYANDVKLVLVKDGESLAKVSQRVGVPVSKLLVYNDFNSSPKLNKGDRIFIKPKRKRFRGRQKMHTVKNNQRMHDIAQLYGIKLKALLKKNRLSPNQEPAVGAPISIKKKVKQAPKLRGKTTSKPPTGSKPSGTTKPPSSSAKVHVVKAGDTLYAISRKYGISVDRIKQLNGLKSNTISVGQRLKLE